MVGEEASRRSLPNPCDYMQEFMLMRTVWAAARNLGYETKAYEEPEKERFWSEFRAKILHKVLDMYENDEPIDPRAFPDTGVAK